MKPPDDFIVVTAKNVAEVKPTVINTIKLSVILCHTMIELVQNILNIEKPVTGKFSEQHGPLWRLTDRSDGDSATGNPT